MCEKVDSGLCTFSLVSKKKTNVKVLNLCMYRVWIGFGSRFGQARCSWYVSFRIVLVNIVFSMLCRTMNQKSFESQQKKNKSVVLIKTILRFYFKVSECALFRWKFLTYGNIYCHPTETYRNYSNKKTHTTQLMCYHFKTLNVKNCNYTSALLNFVDDVLTSIKD